MSGSKLIALRAGKSAAASATMISNEQTIEDAHGSCAGTPYNTAAI